MRALKSVIILIKLIRESLLFAYNAIWANKMRTFLSLLGVTIGIFAIITVFTILDSMEKNVRESIQSLGDNVVYVNKWPWIGGMDFPWWKYINRPQPNLDDLEAIRSNSNLAEAASFFLNYRASLKYSDRSKPEIFVTAVSSDFERIRVFDL
ncbi:MAG TPA: ABC transporter permease, partial [Tenuifilaceae bacterium]|nr:ABC transporter permease [Tenuifilaceae bacterium]